MFLTPRSVTIHILHDNTLTQDNREKFVYIAGRYGQLVKFYNVEKICADKIAEFKNKMSAIENSVYSVGTLYRFVIMNLFPAEIEKVIYLDSDTIVNLDINELWQIALDDAPLAGVSEQANGVPPQILFALCRAGLVADEKYFNAGVLVMNLKILRNEQEKIRAGLTFVAENPQCKFFDQDIFNYCFAAQSLIIPIKFNRLVDYARLAGEKFVGEKIYHYVGNAANFNLRDAFSRLWMEYFLKTAWFNPEVMLRIYDCLQELHAQSQNKLIELSAVMSGKQRFFFAELTNFEKFKQIFHVDKSEEILDATKPDALKILLKKMKKFQSNGFFILLVQKYSELKMTLEGAGFIEGKDFVDATTFFSREHGTPLDTYFLIRAI